MAAGACSFRRAMMACFSVSCGSMSVISLPKPARADPLAQHLVLSPLELVSHVGQHRARVVVQRVRKGHAAAQAVLVGVAVAVHLHVSRERRAEGGLRQPADLQHDPVALEDRLQRPRLHRRGGAVNEQRVGLHGYPPMVEHHVVGLDALHAAQPNDLADALQHRHLARRDGGQVEHRGPLVTVDTQHGTTRLQPQEQVVGGGGLGKGLPLVGLATDGLFEELRRRLGGDAVDQPRVSRHHPRDGVGVGTGVDEPHAGVHGRLAGADDDEAAR